MTYLTRMPLLALFFISFVASAAQQIKDVDTPGVSYTGENNGRGLAVKKVLPTYPEEAIAEGMAGIFEVRVGWDIEGIVRKVKVPPGLNPLLRGALVDAVKQWRFRAIPHLANSTKYMSHRLTFEFLIEDGQGRVELYNPSWDSGAGRRLREYGSPLERREWVDWQDALDNTH
jgi:hypothetical protein